MSELISWKDFEKVDMRVGTVLEVNDFPEARNPAFQLMIDFGKEIGIRKTSAQITIRYTKEELLGSSGDRCGKFSEETNRQFYE